MAARGSRKFFGDDWEDTLDSVLSVPGAFGNIVVAAVKQIKVWDALAMVLVAASVLWLTVGYLISGNHEARYAVAAVLVIVAWLTCGTVAGFFFTIGGVGKRSMLLWESYLLIGLFAAFGTLSLRIALNPKDRLVHRAPTTPVV
jgi:hypothetical protein